MTLQEAVANTIRKYMEMSGTDVARLSELTGLGKTTIYDVIKANVYPEFETVHKICPALGITEAIFENEIRRLCPDFGYDNLPPSYRENLKKLSEAEMNKDIIIEHLTNLIHAIDPQLQFNIIRVPVQK